MDGVILCAAIEFDSAYETLFAFILNDISRRLPCPELFCELSGEIRDRFDRRLELGRFGRLRLSGVVVPQGTSSSELRQELRLAPGLFDFLLDGRGDPADLCRDCDEVKLPDHLSVPPHVDRERLAQVGRALKANEIGVVGVGGRGKPVPRMWQWPLSRPPTDRSASGRFPIHGRSSWARSSRFAMRSKSLRCWTRFSGYTPRP